MSQITYKLVGDFYIPDLKLPEENRRVGHWGRMHQEYLKEHNPIRYDDLILTCRLWTYLCDIDEQAQGRYSLIVEQMKKAESVTEELKKENQMEWVRRMMSIHNRAEEIVLNELIYC